MNNNGYDDPPTISDILITPVEAVVGDQVLISWQDNDPDSNAIISLYYDSDNSGTDGILIAADIQEDDEADIFIWDTADMMPGVYYVYAFVDDTITTASAYSLAAVTILPDNEPPTLDPIGNRTGNEGELLTFAITAVDPNPEDILTFGGANLPDGAIIDLETGVFSWTPTYQQAGNYENVEFSVTDNGDPMGVDSELISITIGQINRPPMFVPVGSQEVRENELLSFTVLASDPDGDSFVFYAASGLPDGADFNPVTAVFSWTPDNSQAGAYTYIVEFSATDNGEPPAVGILQVAITVGDVPTPVEQAEMVVDEVLTLNLEKKVGNSYLANLKKVGTFIEDGKITPAINQLKAFIGKVELDIVQGRISPPDGNGLIIKAEGLIADLGG